MWIGFRNKTWEEVMKKTGRSRGRTRILSFLLALVMVFGCMVVPTEKVQAASKTWNKVNGVCYNGKGVKIPGAITRGIDVSSWQGSINWTKVAGAGIDFAFIRVGHSYGTTLTADSYLAKNLSGANAAGIPVGVYYYSGAKTTAQAKKEAEYVIEKIQGYKISYPVVFDLESSTLISGLTNAQRANLAVAFCDVVEKAGYYPMLYCNTYWYNTYINKTKVAGLDKWMAAYGDSKTSLGISATHTIWQATDGNKANGLTSTAGLIAGIPTSNTVDIDFGYVDYTKKIAPRTYKKSSSTDVAVSDIKESGRKGWYTTKYGYTYYYKNGQKCTGWQTISGRRYYFSKAGRMQIGMKKIGGKSYYFSQKKTSKNPKGAMVTGWYTTSSGNKYYFRTSGSAKGAMYQNHWITYNGHKYFFKSNGVMKTGWQDWKGSRYYLRSKEEPIGSMMVGSWLKYNGKYYYLKPKTGKMARNTTLTINGKKYKFDNNGVYYK